MRTKYKQTEEPKKSEIICSIPYSGDRTKIKRFFNIAYQLMPFLFNGVAFFICH